MSEREPPRAAASDAQPPDASVPAAAALVRAAAPLCICRGGIIEVATPAFAALVCPCDDAGDLGGREFVDLVVPEQRAEVRQRILGDGESGALPLVLLRGTSDVVFPIALTGAPLGPPAEGRRVVHAQPLLLAGGAPLAPAGGNGLDRLVLEVLPDAVFIVQEATIRFANRAALELLRREDPRDLVGRPFASVVVPHEVPELLRRLEDVARRGRPASPRVVRLQPRSGEPIEVEVLNVPLVLDGRPAVQVVARDLRAFRHAAAELRVTEARFRRILEASHSVYWILHLTDVAEVDTAAESDFERPYSSGGPLLSGATAQPSQLLRGQVSPADWERFRAAVQNALEHRRSSGWVDMTVEHGGGRGLPAVWRSEIFPLIERGAVTGVQGISQEVTSLRALEERLRESQKLEALGRLSGAIAHDFNNILETIVGFAALIRDGVAEGEIARGHADTVLRAATRAADLTRQLQAFGRTGRVAYRAVSLNDIVRDVVSLLPPAVVGRLRVEQDLDPALGPVWGDPGQLHQVLLNLVVNAADAMPDGGAMCVRTRLLNAVRALPVVDGTLPRGRYALLRVRDTGAGIPDDVVPHVFEPFYSTKSDNGDARHQGLGLSVVYGVVRQHGGGVRVRSRPGQGTTFDVVLPLSDRRPEEAREPAAAAAVAGGGERILVVDDEPDILLLDRTVLGRAGYEVVVAASGADAVRTFEREAGTIGAVILDLVLPDRSGGEVFAAIRAIAPHVPVLVASGHDREGVAPEIFQHARTAFLPKPYEPAELVAALRMVLATAEG